MRQSGYIERANPLVYACWPIDCPRFVLSSSGLVSEVADYLEWVDSLPEVCPS